MTESEYFLQELVDAIRVKVQKRAYGGRVLEGEVMDEVGQVARNFVDWYYEQHVDWGVHTKPDGKKPGA